MTPAVSPAPSPLALHRLVRYGTTLRVSATEVPQTVCGSKSQIFDLLHDCQIRLGIADINPDLSREAGTQQSASPSASSRLRSGMLADFVDEGVRVDLVQLSNLRSLTIDAHRLQTDVGISDLVEHEEGRRSAEPWLVVGAGDRPGHRDGARSVTAVINQPQLGRMGECLEDRST